ICGGEFAPKGTRKYCSATCRRAAERLRDLRRYLSRRLDKPPTDEREFFLGLLVHLFDDEPARRALRTYHAQALRTPFEVMKANFQRLFCKELKT
ncbi:MAG: hypothetical protein IJP42_02565, partial [Selenomonadaceae bacterium]|nr:hypothetical protein [Selenomonadaceae bacterium]